MRPLPYLCVLLGLLTLSSRADAQMKNQENRWVLNSTAVAAAAVASDRITGNPWLGSTFAVAVLVGSRWETMRANSFYFDTRREISILLPPLVVGIAISKLLNVRKSRVPASAIYPAPVR